MKVSLFPLALTAFVFAQASANPTTNGNPTPVHNTIRIGNVHCHNQDKHGQPARHCVYMDHDALTYGVTNNDGWTVCEKTTNDDFGGVQGRKVCQFRNEQQTEVKCFSDGSKSLRVSFDATSLTVNEVRGGLKFFWQSDVTRNASGKNIVSTVPGDNLFVHCKPYVKHHGNMPDNTPQ